MQRMEHKVSSILKMTFMSTDRAAITHSSTVSLPGFSWLSRRLRQNGSSLCRRTSDRIICKWWAFDFPVKPKDIGDFPVASWSLNPCHEPSGEALLFTKCEQKKAVFVLTRLHISEIIAFELLICLKLKCNFNIKMTGMLSLLFQVCHFLLNVVFGF